MSRKNGPEPFFRTDRKRWCVQLHGKQYTLGTTETQARKRWHELMSMPAAVESDLVVGVIDGFLEWCKNNRSPRTYEWSKGHLESFCSSLPKVREFPVAALKPHHVLAWADSYKQWGDSHKRGAIGAVQRAFNWAEKVGHIDRNPIRYVEGKPAQGRCDEYLTVKEFRGIIKQYAKDDPFRLALEFTWETGARPQEMKCVEVKHLNAERRRLELPPAEAKGKRRWRIIYLTDKAFEIVSKLAKKLKKGVLFRNEDGKAWTAYATNCRLVRLKEKVGFKVSMYLLRHSFCQRMLEQGLDATTVAGLMGHSNAVMVGAVYSHMSKAKDFLAEQLKRANSGVAV